MEEFEKRHGLTIPVELSSNPGCWGLPRTSKIPRPPNAFMIFANEWRRNIAHEFPELNNKEVSVKLGMLWKSLHKNGKEYYFALARKADVQHKLKYPDYVYNPKEARIRKFLREQCRNSQAKSQRNRKHVLHSELKKSSSVLSTYETRGAEEPVLEAYLPVLSLIDDGLNLSETNVRDEDLENSSPNIKRSSETSPSGSREEDFSDFIQAIVKDEGPRVIVAPAFSDTIGHFRSEGSMPNLEVVKNEDIVIADLDGPNWYPFNMSGQLVASSECQSNNEDVGSILGFSNHIPQHSESCKSSEDSSSGQEPTNIYDMDVDELMALNDSVEIGYIFDHDISGTVMEQSNERLHMLSRLEHGVLTNYPSSTFLPETVTSETALQNLPPLYTLQTISEDTKDNGTRSLTSEERQYSEFGSTNPKTHDWLNHTRSNSPRYINDEHGKAFENVFNDVEYKIAIDLPTTIPQKILSSENNLFSTSHCVYPTSYVRNSFVSPFKAESMAAKIPADCQDRVNRAENFDLENISSFGVANSVESFDSHLEIIKTNNIIDSGNSVQHFKNVNHVNKIKSSPSGHFQYLTRLKPFNKDLNVYLTDNNEKNVPDSEGNSSGTVSPSYSQSSQISSDFEHQRLIETLKSSVNVCFSKGQPLILRRRGTGNEGESCLRKKTAAKECGQPCSGRNSARDAGKENISPKNALSSKTAGEKITNIVNKIVNGDLREKVASAQPTNCG